MLKLKFKKIKQLVVYIIVFFILGCNKSSTLTEEDKFGGSLVYSVSISPTIIHPFLTNDSISVHIVPLIFNGLVKIAEDGDLVPDLAESYEINQNGLEYRITLKRGVKFHDGSELTNKDVKFTYEKIKEINKKKKDHVYDYNFLLVKEIQLIDKYNIKITLKQPFAPFLNSLSVGILPKHIYQGKVNINDDVYWYPVGTGPFKLTYIDSKKIVLNRFDNYFKSKPYLDKIVCRVYPPPLIWVKMLKGEIDYSKFVSLDLLREIKKVNFLKTYNILDSSFYMLFLDCKKPLFRDKKVRQALNYAIDKELMIQKIFGGQGKVCSSPVLPDSWAYNNNIRPYEYNPQKALRRLKKAGWIINKHDGFLYKKGELFNFRCILLKGYPDIEQSAAFIQRQLHEIGIKMELKTVHTTDEFYSLYRNEELDAWFGRLEIPLGFDRNYSLFHSSQIGATNLVNYQNPEIDQLLELERKVFSREKRKRTYYKFQEVLHNDPPGIFTFYKYTSMTIHKKIKNASPDNSKVFRGVENWWIDKDWKRHL